MHIKLFSFIFVCSLFFCCGNACAEETNFGAVRIREVSLQESYKEILEENNRLKKEKRVVENELSKLQSEAVFYANKAKEYDDMSNSLGEEIRELKASNIKHLEALEGEKSFLVECNNSMKESIALLEKETDEALYKIRTKRIQKELAAIKKSRKNTAKAKITLIKENGQMHHELGEMFGEKGEYERAAYEYEQALKLSPDDASIYYNLAVLFDYYLKNPQKASIYYNLYVEKNAKIH